MTYKSAFNDVGNMQLVIKNVCRCKHVCQYEAIHLFYTDDNDDYTSSSIVIHTNNIVGFSDDNTNKMLCVNLKYTVFLDNDDNYYHHFDIGIKYKHSKNFCNDFLNVPTKL
jgi:hypothetical protein